MFLIAHPFDLGGDMIMKKLLSVFLLAIVLLCTLTSCGYDDPTIEVDADGYIIVNGVKTEHKVHTTDEISVNADGFVVVNGVTTNIVADKDDVISVDADGYLVVNGIKTEYEVASEASNKIHYPLSNMGTKIEALPLSEQQKIDDYVYDCKTLFSASYISQLLQYSRLEDSYLSFTDVFVYDLSKIDENNLDGVSAAKWNDIKALNGGVSAPIMYIELSGYCSYSISYYRPTCFSETGMTYGYFIFENETYEPALYKRLSNNYYNYEMIHGAEFINCGDKYSEEKSAEELVSFYETLKNASYEDLFKLLKRLTPIGMIQKTYDEIILVLENAFANGKVQNYWNIKTSVGENVVSEYTKNNSPSELADALFDIHHDQMILGRILPECTQSNFTLTTTDEIITITATDCPEGIEAMTFVIENECIKSYTFFVEGNEYKSIFTYEE